MHRADKVDNKRSLGLINIRNFDPDFVTAAIAVLWLHLTIPCSDTYLSRIRIAAKMMKQVLSQFWDSLLQNIHVAAWV